MCDPQGLKGESERLKEKGKAMNWTKTLPTRTGDYRNRERESEPHWFIEVRRNQGGELEGRLASHKTWHPLNSFEGEWCGPLVPVEEVRRAYYEGHIHAISSDPDMDPQEHSWPNSRASKVVEGKQV